MQSELHIQSAYQAFKIWEIAKPITGNTFPYLKIKQILSFGLRAITNKQLMETGFNIDSAFGKQFTDTEFIIIPIIKHSGVIGSLQFINKADKNNKRFLPGGCKRGCYYPIGVLKNRILLCEGYATGASIHMATGEMTICCFDASNLSPVATNIKNAYPNAEIIICADNDAFHKENSHNKGIEEAKKAGNAIGSYVVYPLFNSLDIKPTDFNDLHHLEGLETVRKQITKAYKGGENV